MENPAKQHSDALQQRNSASPEESREDKASEQLDRPARVPMGAGANLAVSKSILDEIDSQGCVVRWVVDDSRGLVERRLAAYWEFYTDANGSKLTRPAGAGKTNILMILDKKYAEEDRLLKRKGNRDSLQKLAELKTEGGVEDYIPEGREYVISSDI